MSNSTKNLIEILVNKTSSNKQISDDNLDDYDHNNINVKQGSLDYYDLNNLSSSTRENILSNLSIRVEYSILMNILLCLVCALFY